MIPLKYLLILFVCPKIMQTKPCCNRLFRETSLVNLLQMWNGMVTESTDDSTQCTLHSQTSFTPCRRGGQSDTDTSPPLSPSTVSGTIPLVIPLVLVLRASRPYPWCGFLFTLLSTADTDKFCSLPILHMIPLKYLLILFVCPKIMQTKPCCNRLLRETSLVNLLQTWNGLVTESSNVNVRPTSHSCWWQHTMRSALANKLHPLWKGWKIWYRHLTTTFTLNSFRYNPTGYPACAGASCLMALSLTLISIDSPFCCQHW
jgi:hypothetical protein